MPYEAEVAPDAVNDIREIRDQNLRYALSLLFEGSPADEVQSQTGFRPEVVEDLFKLTWSFVRVGSRVVLYRHLTEDERLQLGRSESRGSGLSEALVARIFSIGDEWRMLAAQWLASASGHGFVDVEPDDEWTDDDDG